MQLTTGDKIRIKSTNEGAEIIEVIDEFYVIVETFDEKVKVSKNEVELFQAGDVKDEFLGEISFVPPRTQSKKQNTKPFDAHIRQKDYILDLHAEKLIANYQQKTTEEILSIQISRAKNFINKAIDDRRQQIYLIHGVGSGRLKSEIHDLLRKNSRIRSFSNSYHPQYGMGATEVKL